MDLASAALYLNYRGSETHIGLREGLNYYPTCFLVVF